MPGIGAVSFDLVRFQKPPRITMEELQGKLAHMRAVLETRRFGPMLLTCEGALRWLTGTRHQIIDIAPDAESPVHSLVRPLIGGREGNQFRKLEWLHAMTTAALTETALHLKVGMNGAEVRGMVFNGLASRDVECNLILVALAGQEKHFHPLSDSRYRAERGCWGKLVAGARYSELIVSATAMVKIASFLTKDEARIYAALQQGTVEYADLYRNGARESDIYKEVGERFMRIEKDAGLKGFQPSAHFHHMGGPTSPLGNRDYLLEADGTRRMFPWMQFAINPCDVLQYTKVELQGIVMAEGTPLMLDGSRFVRKDLGLFSEIRSAGGTVASVANVIETAD